MLLKDDPSSGPTDKAGLSARLSNLATGDEDARICRDIPETQCREEPTSFVWQVIAQTFSKTGDVLADSKVVLPWLLGSVGAPAFMTGLLVPIRESLALLPQMLVGGLIRRYRVRKYFWVFSSLVEGTCVIFMGLVAASNWRGPAAGWAIIGLLTVFSLARGLASIAAKDTLGKTVSKGRRGRVSGYASMISGLAASAVGLYLVLSPEETRPDWLLNAIVIAAGLCWFLAAASFAMIKEHPGATEGGRTLGDLARDQIVLLIKDRELQKFLVARALMISTALSGPVYVSLAQSNTGKTLDGLGWLVVASGLAATLSSAVWGILSDKSSRLTMALAAGLSAVLGLAVVAAVMSGARMTNSIVFYAVVLFVLGIAHAGVRIGRKTQIVDLAGGDRKAEYVALSNTIIGILLLAIGAGTSVLLNFGLEFGIAVLSVMALIGAVVALTMENAQR